MSQQQPAPIEPPQAPRIPRKFSLYPYQYIGIPLLLLVPILALLGVFGESFTEVQQTSDELSMTVKYPTRLRYQMSNSMIVSVQNETDEPLANLTISISRDYIDQFSDVHFSPSETRITDTAYEVELRDVPANGTQVVAIHIEGQHYGRHTGSVTATIDGLELVRLQLSTFIFP